MIFVHRFNKITAGCENNSGKPRDRRASSETLFELSATNVIPLFHYSMGYLTADTTALSEL
jgi:hypothetical protein